MSLEANIATVLSSGVERGAVAGVTAAVTDRDGLLYEAGFGERIAGRGPAMTPDTVGMIASMTKAITGTAAMQLVERGVLDLDTPAAAWVPYLGEVQVLEGFTDDGGRAVARQFHAGDHLRTARHDEHELPDIFRHARSPCDGASPRRRRARPD